MEAIDTYIPNPERALDKPFFLPIEHVYQIKGRGAVVTGKLERGIIEKGKDAEVVGYGHKFLTQVGGEGFPYHLSSFNPPSFV